MRSMVLVEGINQSLGESFNDADELDRIVVDDRICPKYIGEVAIDINNGFLRRVVSFILLAR
jgi:hypothetical protein